LSATTTPKAPSATQSSARVSLDAFEILHVIHDTGSIERRAALRAKWVWIGATLVGALVCWQIVADRFALSREVDKYLSLMAIQSASQNGVINHATNIASEAAVLTGGLLVALVWGCSLGLLALVSALYGVLPRIYLGLHYFSDVTAGHRSAWYSYFFSSVSNHAPWRTGASTGSSGCRACSTALPSS